MAQAPFEGAGACLPCPGDGVSAEEGRSCACGAGHFFEAPRCSPCKTDTYKNTTDAGCTACPNNAVSAEGSTSLSACTCPAGFSGDAGSGGSCVPCAAGTYKDVDGCGARGCTNKTYPVLEVDGGWSHPRWGEDASVAACSLNATWNDVIRRQRPAPTG
ncbi:hypothetical protein T484DRAFT_1821350 [Baffinella frigidus]|nr:hypothetical protein T484DRAFT_1821350 [Cryptophyta sp. CCMP2293]